MRFEVSFTGPKCAAERQREEEERAKTMAAVERAETRIQAELADQSVIEELRAALPSDPTTENPTNDQTALVVDSSPCQQTRTMPPRHKAKPKY